MQHQQRHVEGSRFDETIIAQPHRVRQLRVIRAVVAVGVADGVAAVDVGIQVVYVGPPADAAAVSQA